MAVSEEPSADSATPAGVPLYGREDYVGATRHLLISGIDAAVILLVVLPLSSIIGFVAAAFTGLPTLFLPWYPMLCIWCYLAVLRPSRYRSLGYWVCDAKIVTIDGKAPSPLQMTRRLLWTCFWWSSIDRFIVDVFWAASNRERQMIRDLLVQTRLVRNRAKPIGRGKVVRSLLTGWGMVMWFAEVREQSKSS